MLTHNHLTRDIKNIHLCPACDHDNHHVPAVGERIELIEMVNDPAPLPAGMKGTVTFCQWLWDSYQVRVDWDDSASKLMLIIPPDKIDILELAHDRG